MTTGIETELHAFTTDLLERAGGLVDWVDPAAQGVAILPAELGEVLGVKEELSLSCQPRSEEHTSELQSHSFISYAFFCLKKKTK